jgi:glucose/arabinose dehydrogenase
LNDTATPATAALQDLHVIWRDGARGRGGQFGAAVVFAQDGKSLFLTVGDRQRFSPPRIPTSRWARFCTDPGRQARAG